MRFPSLPHPRRFLAIAALSLTIVLLLPTTAPPARATAVPALAQQTLADLMAGKLVIYFRHGATTWPGVDRIEWPRERQRLLSKKGIAQSEAIGAAFRKLGAPVGDVLASPFARCRDMAEIAFGRVDERMELLGLLSDAQGKPARIAYLTSQVSTPTGGAGNRIVIAHRSNIATVAGIRLGEGDAVLLRPLGGGKFETLETLTPEDWTALATKREG